MFTLDNFLKIEPISSYKIISGKDRLTEIPIQYISVIEIPVGDFIRERELVLTTALGCIDDDERFYTFVKEVYYSNAAALVVSTQNSDYAFPKNIADFAREKDFPIVMIPWECRFAEIIETTLDKVRNNELSKVRRYETMQNELLFDYLNSKSLSQIMQTLSSHIKSKVIITNADFEVNGASDNIKIIPKSYISEENRDISIPIEANDRLYGYLVVIDGRIDTDIKYDEDYIRQYSIMPLTLILSKNDNMNITSMKVKNDFISNLASGVYSDDKEISYAAERFGLLLNKAYSCVTGKIVARGKGGEQNISGNMSFIENIIIEIGLSMGRNILVTTHNDVIIIFVENISSDMKRLINELINTIEQKLMTSFPIYKYAWGISEISTQKANFTRYYQNSRLALDICLSGAFSSNRCTYDDIGIFKILSTISDNEEVGAVVDSVLKPFIEHDNLRQLELINTLWAYIKNNYNVSMTARSLHLHRQSLLYRLEKIEQIGNISLQNYNDLFLLELCLRIYANKSINHSS